jgi:hypothetical protein
MFTSGTWQKGRGRLRSTKDNGGKRCELANGKIAFGSLGLVRSLIISLSTMVASVRSEPYSRRRSNEQMLARPKLIHPIRRIAPITLRHHPL